MGLHALVLLLAVPLTAAHYKLAYPEWRGDTLANTNVTKWSQNLYPCAGVPRNATGVNRTDWPLDGGSLVLELHHDWTYIFVNLVFGVPERETYNISLTPEFLNSTGSGVLCIEKLALPSNATDGQLGSMQVVTVGDRGNALYNCAELKFTSSATTLKGDQCKSNNVTYVAVKQQAAGQGGGACPPKPSAATGLRVNVATCVVALTIALAFGLTL